MATYSQTNYQNFILDPIPYANIGSTLTIQNSMNRAARIVSSEVDLRSTKRRVALASKLFDDIYSYAAPSDLKGTAIIDFDPQSNRLVDSRLVLVPEQRFYQKKTVRNNIIALATDDLAIRLLYSSSDPVDTQVKVATFDSATAEGSWSVFGDATTLTTDTSVYIEGASQRFNLGGAGTTAGLQNSTITAFDITNYVADGSVFVWVYINSTTNLTNWILRIGTDSSNYYTQTVTTDAASNSFVAGWNLLRFDFASMSQTGTVTLTSCRYVNLYMTKSSGKNDSGYRFDKMVLHTGQYFDVIYYSKYPWQTSSGTFLENSTAGTDKLNADTDEIDLLVAKGKSEVLKDLRMWDEAKLYEAEYQELKKNYIKKNPSERCKAEDIYYNINLY